MCFIISGWYCKGAGGVSGRLVARCIFRLGLAVGSWQR